MRPLIDWAAAAALTLAIGYMAAMESITGYW